MPANLENSRHHRTGNGQPSKEINILKETKKKKEKQGISKKVEDLSTFESYVLWERVNEGKGKVPRTDSHWG